MDKTFDIEKYKQRALRILAPIKQIDKNTSINSTKLFHAQRSNAGRNLPEYYLVYFLFGELLGFKNAGQFEKIAWSFTIDFNGKAYVVEYRKMGLGIFVQDAGIDEKDAEIIANKIRIAVMSAPPFYEYIAKQAINRSELNVVNNNIKLLARFDFLLELYNKENNKYLKSKGKVKRQKTDSITNAIKLVNVEFTTRQQTIWLAISCIDAFFSWTEHLFIHLAIVGQNLSDGNKVTTLMLEDWQTKFKIGIPNSSKDLYSYFNELIAIRQQVRNFIAHGAFGKDGTAFYFHSNTGAVPVKMDYKKGKKRFSLEHDLTFDYEDAIKLIQDFINSLNNGSLELHMLYTQKYALPTVLTFASSGFYQTAMTDIDSFESCAEYISKIFDDAGNMDW